MITPRLAFLLHSAILTGLAAFPAASAFAVAPKTEPPAQLDSCPTPDNLA